MPDGKKHRWKRAHKREASTQQRGREQPNHTESKHRRANWSKEREVCTDEQIGEEDPNHDSIDDEEPIIRIVGLIGRAFHDRPPARPEENWPVESK